MAANVQDVFMLFGDSITQLGWRANTFAQRLACAYVRKIDIINRGLSGYNTEWAIPIFEQTFAKQQEQQHVPKVRLLTIWFGANDAAVQPSRQHVPLPKFISNLTRLIHTITSPDSQHYSPITRIILITPPPVNTHQWEIYLHSRDPPTVLDRHFETTRKYAEAVMDVGAHENLPVIDAWNLLYNAAGKNEADLDQYLEDGLHLTAAAYDIMYEALMNTIGEEYPELQVDQLKDVFPSWE